MALTSLPENRAASPDGGCLDAELLASYIDGRTTAEERVKIETHLASCEDCYFAFSETVQEQQAEPGKESRVGDKVQPRSRSWLLSVATPLATAAGLIVGVLIYGSVSRERQANTLTTALRDLDAAAGPYRTVQPRLTLTPAYRELEPALRSAAPSAEASLALRDAALQVEKAATARSTGARGQQALGVMYLALGRPNRAAEILAPLASSQDAGQLNDVAAALLARHADDDVNQALSLLERAVKLDPRRAEAWFNLGLAAEAAQQRARARAAWTNYLAIDPSSPWAREAQTHLDQLSRGGASQDASVPRRDDRPR